MMRDESWWECWNLYEGKCVMCLAPASGVHEIEPRADKPTGWNVISNRVPLCTLCHEKVQQNPAAYADQIRKQAEYLLQALGGEIL